MSSPSPRETKCTMPYSNTQISQYVTDEDMVKLFKRYIRSYYVDIRLMHEDFEVWISTYMDDCPECNDDTDKKCSKCLKNLKSAMKDREY